MIDHGAPPSTPLARVITLAGRWKNITLTMISNTLNTAVVFCRPNLVFESKDVSACSLCDAGSMSLLCSGLYINIINIIDCYDSDEILRYLHVQAEPLMRNFLRLMLTYGNHYFLLHQ